jgi:hypothetical protein
MKPYRVQAMVEKDPPRILRVFTPAKAREIARNVIAEKNSDKITSVSDYWRHSVEPKIKRQAKEGHTRCWVFDLKNKENSKRLADYGKSIGWDCSAGDEDITIKWGNPLVSLPESLKKLLSDDDAKTVIMFIAILVVATLLQLIRS